MTNTLAELLQQTIDPAYQLERKDRIWTLHEHGKTVEIRLANRHSFAFSLDRANPKPFAFFSGSPPHGVNKMCDAILACHHRGDCYLFSIEMKTKHKDSYKHQLENGRLFCDWLIQLYRCHGHLEEKPISIGLLIWFPRPGSEKQGTVHRKTSGITKSQDQRNFDHVLEIANRSSMHIHDLVKSAKS
ncbi:MAG: hypothetical protein GDA55_02005 [Cellvibrionales bacterium]|nr:hypothetical protein [Cellvibrionales bacterium]